MNPAGPSGGFPVVADFAGPPSATDRSRWAESDRQARPERLTRLRARFADAGVDAYFGVRPEHMRYLTGFTLANGEEKVAGTSGQFLVGRDEVVLLADSRYTVQARREAPDARIQEAYGDLPSRWSALCGSLGVRRVAMESEVVSQATWSRLQAAAPGVELVPAEGWLESDRAVKEPAELERVAAACAVADRALGVRRPRPGVLLLNNAHSPPPSTTIVCSSTRPSALEALTLLHGAHTPIVNNFVPSTDRH